ncbi:MAG: hypothetical protein Tsb0010_17840 [Parvularculaceae bacterium]
MRRKALLSLIPLALAASPTLASAGDDIAACRDAIAAQFSQIDESYRAKVERVRGNRVRAYTLRLSSPQGGTNYEALCRVRRGEVIEVALSMAM